MQATDKAGGAAKSAQKGAEKAASAAKQEAPEAAKQVRHAPSCSYPFARLHEPIMAHYRPLELGCTSVVS